MLHLNKKGQGISLNVIIIAAIALLVLVILAVIFLGRIGDWGQQVGECENKNGRCAFDDVSCGEDGSNVADYPVPYGSWRCPEDQHCCIKG